MRITIEVNWDVHRVVHQVVHPLDDVPLQRARERGEELGRGLSSTEALELWNVLVAFSSGVLGATADNALAEAERDDGRASPLCAGCGAMPVIRSGDSCEGCAAAYRGA